MQEPITALGMFQVSCPCGSPGHLLTACLQLPQNTEQRTREFFEMTNCLVPGSSSVHISHHGPADSGEQVLPYIAVKLNSQPLDRAEEGFRICLSAPASSPAITHLATQREPLAASCSLSSSVILPMSLSLNIVRLAPQSSCS